ncbi:6186_t:CDS:10, partial [Funneliformis geosporum]
IGLGKLGVVDDKYDVSISTACPALNDIVVDSVEVGQTCVKHLGKNNLGIAFGKIRRRVVTLNGELIDKYGTMSGSLRSTVERVLSSLESQLQEKKDELPKLEFESLNYQKLYFTNKFLIETSPSKIEEEIKILQDKILEIWGDKLRAQKSKQIVKENLEELNNDRKYYKRNSTESQFKIQKQIEDSERNLIENKQKEIHWQKSLNDLTLHEIGGDYEQEFQIYTDDELDAMNKDTLQGEIDILKEYNIREKEYNLRNECKDNYDNLRKQRLDEFIHGFNFISQNLKEIYQRYAAEKSWKNMSNLSGGEKTFSSLALVFALHHFKPTPIYVMDKIDATLDFPDHLIGVYKTDDQ